MLQTPWLALSLVGFLLATHIGALGLGSRLGERAADARHEAARQATEERLFREADRLSELALELDRAQDELRARAREAEDAARLDFDVCRVPSADSLHRLRRRWAPD